MNFDNRLLNAFQLDRKEAQEIKALSSRIGIPYRRLLYYNDHNVLPSGQDLKIITSSLGVSELELMLKMGVLNQNILELIARSSTKISEILDKEQPRSLPAGVDHKLVFGTDLGKLYQGDCLSLMSEMEDDTVDLVFADPPFNLNKVYPSGMDDNISDLEYIDWTEAWLAECIRILKPGGSLFVWNIPKWNTYFSGFLNQRLTFRHWISVDIKYSLPISGRLYPSHYALLYYCKGEKPSVFHPDRMPMELCPKCYGDLKDYGGYKNKMNPGGINLTDVWNDIPPVRHKKYKGRQDANELSVKLLDRIIEMSSNEKDVVFDPFGGAGTTYLVSEIKNRKWIGIELGPTDDILERFNKIDHEKKLMRKYRENYNALFPENAKKERKRRNLWTDESFSENGTPSIETETGIQGKLFLT